MADRDTHAMAVRDGPSARRRPSRRGPPPLLHDGCALFLDIDGTLLELAPTPDDVSVDAGIAALLPALARRLHGAVALITGRSMADADRLFRGLSLPVAGQHGLERRAADGSLASAPAIAQRARTAAARSHRIRRAARWPHARGQGRDAGASLPAGATSRVARPPDAALSPFGRRSLPNRDGDCSPARASSKSSPMAATRAP